MAIEPTDWNERFLQIATIIKGIGRAIGYLSVGGITLLTLVEKFNGTALGLLKTIKEYDEYRKNKKKSNEN